LGVLEDMGIHLAAIYGTVKPKITGKAVVVFAADHGVTDAGVSAYPKAVTEQMVLNFLRGGAAISVLSQTNNIEMLVVDVGVDADFPEHPKLLSRKVARGTKNMLESPAMTHDEVLKGLEVGIEAAKA
jgi:nicotinate-nucleotide--dimethylbenzimidazole phosphoribosyltransferase